jgi:hypothetical protein
MTRTWAIIGVRDVPASFKWYQSLLGQAETAPGHDYFGQIRDSDGTVLLCLDISGARMSTPSLMTLTPKGRSCSGSLPLNTAATGLEVSEWCVIHPFDHPRLLTLRASLKLL